MFLDAAATFFLAKKALADRQTDRHTVLYEIKENQYIITTLSPEEEELSENGSSRKEAKKKIQKARIQSGFVYSFIHFKQTIENAAI